jgi:predicted transcriptional regulator of viral defense system
VKAPSNTAQTHLGAALEAARRLGVFRARDFVASGFPREYLRRLGQSGGITQLGRGLYSHRGFEPGEHQTLVEAAKRVPDGVVCLLSALAYHRLGTQAPHAVWLALPRGHRLPRVADLSVRLLVYSRETHAAGCEEHALPGGTVRVYSPAKTVADCFKFRSKVGLDVCIEALSDCLRQKRATLPEIERHAKLCRVSRVMRPYLEAMQ